MEVRSSGVLIQLSRQQWEATLLKQQRDALTTVSYEHHHTDTALEKNTGHRVLAASVSQSEQSALNTTDHADRQPPAGAQSAALLESAQMAAALRKTSYSQQLSSYLQSPIPTVRNTATAASPENAKGPSPRSELPTFALWRNDDTVRLTMRLRDPERAMTEVVPTLHTWLKRAGLTLTRVVVNGRIYKE